MKPIKNKGMCKPKHIVLGVPLIFFLNCEFNGSVVKKEKSKDSIPITVGTVVEPFNDTDYDRLVYVNGASRESVQKGTKKAPYTSIAEALSNLKGERSAILVAMGNYHEKTLKLRPGIDLIGGFHPLDWSRNIEAYKTVLSGSEQHRVIIAADSCRVDGFVITEGTTRGKGGAVYCDGTSPTITNNVFIGNQALKPLDWNPEFWHKTANDGGAIYGKDGASPVIRNNIFIRNKTENGRGGAVAFDNKCDVIIVNNVFLENVAGLDDPMRSSDGGAISIFNWCSAQIKGNVFLGNKALSKNDGGSVFVALWSSAKITGNIMVDSESGDDAGALFIGGQEHRYDAPLDPIPPKKDFYVTIDNNQFYGNKNSSMNSGALRFTMESRGEFTNNRLAHNNGVYFQRSEVMVKNNIILDDFLFIETKEGLEHGAIEDNVIWGAFELTVPAKVSGNTIRDGYNGGTNNRKGIPEFVDDAEALKVISATFDRQRLTTFVHVLNRSHPDHHLANRVVRANGKWGVVKTNTGASITLWGDFNGTESLQILPTYTLLKK